MADEIINKVAQSGLITINLSDYYPKEEKVVLDIADKLFQGLILREKEFRDYVASENWARFSGKLVAVLCSADAIIPTWAYMLLAIHLQPHAKFVFFGTPEQMDIALMQEKISQIDAQQFKDARVVIKGCSDFPVPVAAYVQLTSLLRPYVKSIMYGEPCSTVPLFKRK